MIENLDKLENNIASQLRFDRYYRTILKNTNRVLGPNQAGYLGKYAYKRGVMDLIEYIEDTLVKNPKLLKFRLNKIKEDYA